VIAVVVDASVAAKWFLPSNNEPLVDEAFHLLRRYTVSELRILVPDLFWAELGNVLWKSARLGRCTESAARAALASMRDRNLTTVSSPVLIERAFDIATTFGRTVYDGLYVALAVASRAQMITADEKLANALAARLPVKWLGAF
jgi:predicted nucleic acid-binding protein